MTTDRILNSATPFHDAYLDAKKAAEIANIAWEEDDSCPNSHRLECSCHTALATLSADCAEAEWRTAWVESGEPKFWRLTEDGEQYNTVRAGSLSEALEIAVANVDKCNYEAQTVWVDVCVELDGEPDVKDSRTIALDPHPPMCIDRHLHAWRSPHSVVGGIEQNPGIFCSGGGIRSIESCAYCGAYRHTDTWATRPDTGEQGYISVSYQDADERSLGWVARRRASRQVDDRLARDQI